MNTRLKQLDSLRGIAAMIVVAYHLLLLLPIMNLNTFGQQNHFLLNIVKYTPLRLFFSGTQAVILFFILSGFVLSLPFFHDTKIKVSHFLIKRVCRIYIPYIVAVFVGVLTSIFFSRGGVVGLDTGESFISPISWDLIVNHLLMVFDFDSSAFDPPIWSLVHEMRVSLVFPVLVLLLKYSYKVLIPLVFCLSIVGLTMGWLIPVSQPSLDYFLTVHYMSMFLVGGILAKYKNNIVGFYEKLKTKSKVLVFVFGWLCVTYPWWFMYNVHFFHMFNDWAVTAGASLFIVAALADGMFSKILLKKPFLFVGKISYSLYLYHAIILFIGIKVLYGIVPFWVMCLIIAVVAFLVSALAHYLVEVPSISLGRSLTNRRKYAEKTEIQTISN